MPYAYLQAFRPELRAVMLQPTFLLALFLLKGVHAQSPPNSAQIPSRLWASSPAVNYNDCYLLGNGRLGGAVQGAAQSETIAVNEDSLWSGGHIQRVNPDAAAYMPQMQSLIRAQGNSILDAAQLASFAYVGTPVSTRHFDVLGQVQLTMNHSSSTSNYQRWLDVGDATSGIYYENSGIAYMREYLASNPADVLAIHINATKAGAITFQIHLQKGTSLNRFEDYSTKVGNDTVVMGGHSASATGIEFSAGAKVVASGGNVYTIGDTLFCDSADEATIYFSSWTSFRQSDPQSAVLSTLSNASTQSYESIRSQHVADYQTYANRVSLNLGASSTQQKSMQTTDRFSALPNAFDPELAALYFQFGRYLFISTSRNGSLPPNLQGMWNTDMDPMWGSKYTININTEMNYWPSLVTNLADLNTPLFDLLESVRQTGMTTAKTMYNISEGYVCHHNTDMWGDSAPQDNSASSTFWPSGGAWLATHVGEYYRFTQDASTLQQRYDLLMDAATFMADFLTDYKDWKVTNPTLSPENEYYLPNSSSTAAITLGSTIDNSILWELFGMVLEAQNATGIKDTQLATLMNTRRAQLPPLMTNSFGGIREWIEDYKETDPGHRHWSPLFGLYPGSQITIANSTTFNAAKVTLMRRLSNGSGDTGWSRAWSISLASRLFMPDVVHSSLMQLLYNYTYFNGMLDTGPPAPFQVDGNFGGTAGIAEALVQSHETVATNETANNPTYLIRLLPALPTEWAMNGGGHVTGLRARGGFEADVFWNSTGGIVNATLTSLTGNSAWVTVGSANMTNGGNLTEISIEGVGTGAFLSLKTMKGGKYLVMPA